MKRQVVVVGLGRFGSSVVRSLYNLGHDVLAIDSDEMRVQGIMGQATHALTADATNETVLRDLGIQDYDAAVVAIGSNIVPSIMASVLLKTMGVPYVVARAYNELHGNTLERIGVDKVVQAESEMAVTPWAASSRLPMMGSRISVHPGRWRSSDSERSGCTSSPAR